MLNVWEGRKVRLRAVESGDWVKFHENDRDSEAARMYDAVYMPRSADGTRSWTEQQAAKRAMGDNAMLAVETLEGELTGSLAIHSCDPRNGTFKYGVAIFRPHWRRGYASEAVKLMLRYYFHELRYEKALAHVYAFNPASVALQERLGFQREGILRGMIYTNGQRHDEYIYGLLRSEFGFE